MGLSELTLTLTIGLVSWSDWRERKIYNRLLLPAFMLALVFNTWDRGLSGLSATLMGAGVGMALLIIPFVMGGMGAGDVKFLAVIGAFGGVDFVLQAFLYGAIIGGLIAAVLLARRQALRATLIKFFLTMPFWGKPRYLHESMSSAAQEKFPYGIVLALGTLIVMFLP
ncbi:A24 family peptidase [Paradesulfitobacterium aromaticivorans]